MWLYLVSLQLIFPLITGDEELYQKDVSGLMQIGHSDDGYKSVQLKCGSNSMQINLETDNDFLGVIYTRGSFHNKSSPCYLDPGSKRGQRAFSIKFPLDQCNTKKEGESYSNVLVLQHDKELIMPGDAAFNLECDYSQPRDVTVSANLHNKKRVASKISLADADPAVKNLERQRRSTVESGTGSVILKKHIEHPVDGKSGQE